MKRIDIKYFNEEMTKLAYIGGVEKSNWIDLRCARTMELKAGEFYLIPLGVAMRLPEGYEAHLLPRGSTYKNYGIIQTNSKGIIDNSYSGDNDEWKMPVLATRDVTIPFNERIAQFRIVEIMGDVGFNEVKNLDEVSRGGFGSTGVK